MRRRSALLRPVCRLLDGAAETSLRGTASLCAVYLVLTGSRTAHFCHGSSLQALQPRTIVSTRPGRGLTPRSYVTYTAFNINWLFLLDMFYFRTYTKRKGKSFKKFEFLAEICFNRGPYIPESNVRCVESWSGPKASARPTGPIRFDLRKPYVKPRISAGKTILKNVINQPPFWSKSLIFSKC